MRPVKFKEANITFAKDQPEYQQLSAYKNEDGTVITQWQLSIKERFKILFIGKFWLTMLTFNKPLQPILPSIKKPIIR